MVGMGTVAVIGAVVLFWFQPQKLLIDEAVDEAAPEATELAGGAFVSLDHRTSGTATVLDVGDGARVVRLDGLATDNGPDLYLYLSANPPAGEESAFDDDFVSLGRLKGNQGDQNYDLPDDVDLDRYASVVIWCDRFDAAFGAAPLV
jgi:hypothetical protein